MKKARSVLFVCVWVCALCGPGPFAFARLEVQVSHVGFPAVGRGDIIRSGCWTPVYVDISLVDQPSFDGTVRAGQSDTDGDQAVDWVEVHLRAETGGHTQLMLYLPANPAASDSRFHVEIRDQEGSIVQVVSDGVVTSRAAPSEPPEIVGHDDFVVLSVSDGAIGPVKDLAGTLQGSSFRQTIHVAHISPAQLPEHWIGLDSIDYVVWEDAKPENLTPRQLGALIEWCRYGGTIFISASQTLSTFAMTKPLASIMPADVLEIVSVKNLPKTRETLVGPPPSEKREREASESWHQMPFPAPVPVALAKARKDAQVVAFENVSDSSGKEKTGHIITRARVGNGHLVLCSIRLKDLFSAPGEAPGFFEKIFHFIPASTQSQAGMTPVSLFSNVASAVGFVRSRSAYLVTTILFAIAYVVAATWGTWAFLSARGWRQHSWTAFALVALAAGTIAGLAVGATRGITDRLQQIAVIDAAAGESFGRATTFFGLKSGLDRRLDLWLPSNWLMDKEPEMSPCFLRPLPAGTDWRGDLSFSDPEEYKLRPASAEVAGARLRATLKRFEGRWEGPLGGNLTGQLAVRDRVLTEDSYIVNNLGVDLSQCRLVHSRLSPESIAADRSSETFVYTISGTLPSDGTKIRLYDRCFQLSGPQKVSDIVNASKLKNRHKEWSSQFAGLMSRLSFATTDDPNAALGREKEALMLLSTIGDFDPSVLPSTFGNNYTLSRDRLRQLDLREHLTAPRKAEGDVPAAPGTMVLIGFAQGGGPIRLFSRSGEKPYEAVNPEEDGSWCMYRIRLPYTDMDTVAVSE